MAGWWLDEAVVAAEVAVAAAAAAGRRAVGEPLAAKASRDAVREVKRVISDDDIYDCLIDDRTVTALVPRPPTSIQLFSFHCHGYCHFALGEHQ